MKKLKLSGKTELTKDEMKKINGGMYACIATNRCTGGNYIFLCDWNSETDCYSWAGATCHNDSCCDYSSFTC
ncbi:hypothetical protein [Mucilaginibacter auburnensis]|uniref:hypothetical protein n=1 Tax=Mucilaginibacter auburnensis TaxID=1457233 RepID=UPI0012FE5DE2|nr:hypothetical protein [Mucilaginibacter auburnensis]